MEDRIEEEYTKEGKELFELVQEWIDENNSFLYYNSNKKSTESS